MLFVVRGLSRGRWTEVIVEASSLADARRRAHADGHFLHSTDITGIWERRDQLDGKAGHPR